MMKTPLFLKIVVTNGKKTLQENGLIYTQSCGTKRNSLIKLLLMNSRGEMIEIQQYIEPQNKLMTLTKQNFNSIKMDYHVFIT